MSELSNQFRLLLATGVILSSCAAVDPKPPVTPTAPSAPPLPQSEKDFRRLYDIPDPVITRKITGGWELDPQGRRLATSLLFPAGSCITYNPNKPPTIGANDATTYQGNDGGQHLIQLGQSGGRVNSSNPFTLTNKDCPPPFAPIIDGINYSTLESTPEEMEANKRTIEINQPPTPTPNSWAIPDKRRSFR